MSRNRLFQVLVAIALVPVVALTAREALATMAITSTETIAQCMDLPSRYSLHTEEVNGMQVTYTEDGRTGVDGGLKELMTAYRTCSR
jgi:hypothetical protein